LPTQNFSTLFDFRALSMTRFTLALYFHSLTHSLRLQLILWHFHWDWAQTRGLEASLLSLLSRFPSIFPANATTVSSPPRIFIWLLLHAMLHEVLIEVYPAKIKIYVHGRRGVCPDGIICRCAGVEVQVCRCRCRCVDVQVQVCTLRHSLICPMYPCVIRDKSLLTSLFFNIFVIFSNHGKPWSMSDCFRWLLRTGDHLSRPTGIKIWQCLSTRLHCHFFSLFISFIYNVFSPWFCYINVKFLQTCATKTINARWLNKVFNKV